MVCMETHRIGEIILRYFVKINDDKSNDFFVITTDNVPSDISSVALEVSTEDHDKYFSNNGKYRFVKSDSSAIAGFREYTLLTNASIGDTIKALGETIAANTDFTIGTDMATTVSNIVTLLKSNTKFVALYSVESSDSTVKITELVAGGGNTPPEVTTTGAIVINNGTSIVSTPSTVTATLEEIDTASDALENSITELNTTALAKIKKIEAYYTACLTSSLYTDTEMATILEQIKTDKLTIVQNLQKAQEVILNG